MRLLGDRPGELQDHGVLRLADAGLEDQGDRACRLPCGSRTRRCAARASARARSTRPGSERCRRPSAIVPCPSRAACHAMPIPMPPMSMPPMPIPPVPCGPAEARMLTPLNLTTSVLFGPAGHAVERRRGRADLAEQLALGDPRQPLAGAFQALSADVDARRRARGRSPRRRPCWGRARASRRWASCTAFQPLGSRRMTNRPIWT